MQTPEMAELESWLGHRFRRPELLEQALTHSSHAREVESRGETSNDNEQLEFLGDAVLGLVVSESLLQRFPHFSEGNLSKLRAHVVSARHLARVAKESRIGQYLSLGRGEEMSGGRSKSALLVDSLEAVLAAMYLDGGMEPVRKLIHQRILDPELERLASESDDGLPVSDHKSALQEMAHTMGRTQPAYHVVRSEGPEHRKTFTVEGRLYQVAERERPEIVVEAEGPSKKAAEQRAAKKLLDYLRAQPKVDASNPQDAPV